MKGSISIAAPQTTSSGPKYFSGGIVGPAIRRAATESISRFSAK